MAHSSSIVFLVHTSAKIVALTLKNSRKSDTRQPASYTAHLPSAYIKARDISLPIRPAVCAQTQFAIALAQEAMIYGTFNRASVPLLLRI